ncbi:hypothetical protein AC579_2678 [Pseudocercospora musae]|uniref:NAD-dependent epimerase/dehydratase domain-containing protein n=1 Tax=Pseudocercospora musae TaxID=113226 RepID=A0A139IVZ6_9PEZI|nr:hypothetical protein AC579_2678 [Pseudocercospora musae]
MFNSLDETEHLTVIASDFHVIIHATASWHTASARALFTVHIFGPSNLSDRPHSAGYIETRTISAKQDVYSYENYRESSEVYVQRTTTDIAVIEEGDNCNVKTHIVIAPTIFALGTSSANRFSIQLPAMIKAALENSECLVIGDEKTTWSHVHIRDLAELFKMLLKRVASGDGASSETEGILFGESEMHTHLELSQRLARAGEPAWVVGFRSGEERGWMKLVSGGIIEFLRGRSWPLVQSENRLVV